MESSSVENNQAVVCDCCFLKVYDTDILCNNCGYPLKGDQIEQKKFITNRSFKEINHDSYKKSIKTAGTTLYWVAALCVISGVLQYISNTDEESKFYVLIGNLIIAIAFIALGSWSVKKPLIAILFGTAMYIILQALNMIYDPVTLSRNFVVKILVAIVLIRGLISAINIDKVRKELNIKK